MRLFYRSKTGATISGVCGCESLANHEDVMVKLVAQRGPLGVNVNSILWHDYIGKMQSNPFYC